MDYEKTPDEQRINTMVPIYKKKGGIQSRSNYNEQDYEQFS